MTERVIERPHHLMFYFTPNTSLNRPRTRKKLPQICEESGNGESSATECKFSTLTELHGLLDFARKCPGKMSRDVVKLSSFLFEEKQTVNVMLTYCGNCLNSGPLDINHNRL